MENKISIRRQQADTLNMGKSLHSRYVRTVGDLPCAGRQVVLKLTVRKFLCSVPDCPRTMFTERLPDLVQSYARVTNRLREALVALGLATSAEVSERVAPSLGMLVSAPTLLRRLRTVSCPPPTTVRILGVDGVCPWLEQKVGIGK
jgi:transposase